VKDENTKNHSSLNFSRLLTLLYYINKPAFWKNIIFHIPEGILVSHVGIAGYLLLFVCPEKIIPNVHNS
jgi:hypothetical protein